MLDLTHSESRPSILFRGGLLAILRSCRHFRSIVFGRPDHWMRAMVEGGAGGMLMATTSPASPQPRSRRALAVDILSFSILAAIVAAGSPSFASPRGQAGVPQLSNGPAGPQFAQIQSKPVAGQSVAEVPQPSEPPAPALAWRSIILGGSTDVEEAERMLAKVKRVAGLVHSETHFSTTTRFEVGTPLFGKGFPQLVRSDEIVGLRPGYQVVIGGYCENLAEAETARDLSYRYEKMVVSAGPRVMVPVFSGAAR